MSRLLPVEWMLKNLAGEITVGRREYLKKEHAHMLLVKYTRQDLGFDVVKWRKWFAEQVEIKQQIERTRRE